MEKYKFTNTVLFSQALKKGHWALAFEIAIEIDISFTSNGMFSYKQGTWNMWNGITNLESINMIKAFKNF